MKKSIISFVTILSLLSGPLVFGNDFSYDEEDDELFNRGKAVGKESDEFERAQRRTRFKNWSLAFTTTALGIATFILVAHERGK